MNLTYYSWVVIIALMKTINCQVTAGSLTTAEKQHLLDMHNDLRNDVATGSFQGLTYLPEARDMNELLWV